MFIISTYEGGQPPANAAWFCKWLDDMATDFRVGNAALTSTRLAVFGCGSSVYGAHFNAVAKRLDAQLAALGGQRMVPLGLGDDASANMAAQFAQWASTVLHTARTGEMAVPGTVVPDAPRVDAKPGRMSDMDADSSEEEDAGLEEDAAQSMDIEDLAGPTTARGGVAAKDLPADTVLGEKEMLNAVQRASLTKQVGVACLRGDMHVYVLGQPSVWVPIHGPT